MIRKLFPYLRYVARVVTGRVLLDPVEVFFLPEKNTFYPINSKAGCSSVKLTLIRMYAPEVNLKFPEIHTPDPATLTENRVQRILFWTTRDYLRFARGKKVVLVTRNPYARMYSCYRAHAAGKNIMHYSKHRLRRLLGFSTPTTFEQFVSRCSRVPGRFGDRHYRPQSFYLPIALQAAVETSETVDLVEFVATHRPASNTAPLVLNRSGESLPPAAITFMKQHAGFNHRYRRDLEIYH